MKITDITWNAEDENSKLPSEIDVPENVYKNGCSTDEIIA